MTDLPNINKNTVSILMKDSFNQKIDGKAFLSTPVEDRLRAFGSFQPKECAINQKNP